jgi:Flp pilus assembly protein TadG
MTAKMRRTGVHNRREGRQRGQSLVEFAISSIVLLLLMMGLLDLSRAFYYAVNLQGAAREGARHGAWFNTATRSNNYLDDADIMSAVNSSLAGSGLVGTFVPGGCLSRPTATASTTSHTRHRHTPSAHSK